MKKGDIIDINTYEYGTLKKVEIIKIIDNFLLIVRDKKGQQFKIII